MKINKLFVLCIIMLNFCAYAETKSAPAPWSFPKISKDVYGNVLYIPIVHDFVKNIPIKESDEQLVDLLKVNNPRIKSFATFDLKYKDTYAGYSRVRLSVYEKLIA
jgi:hypothetical protein